MNTKRPGFNAIQKTVYRCLSDAFPDIPVADYVEENLPFPYIAIGEDDLVDDSTKTDFSDSALVTVRVWSRAKGFSEVKGILARAISALSSVVAEEDGYYVRYYGVSQMETSREPDGITRSGMARIKIRISQNF